MKRPLRPEEVRLWSLVTATVRPARPSRRREAPPELDAAKPPGTAAEDKPGDRAAPPARLPIEALKPPRPKPPPGPPEHIEPGRKRRIAREREAIGGRLDLHGYDQDRARAVLHAFIARSQDEGARAVLIITGKGARGDGVLRRRVPDWLAEAPSRARVAGVSQAERHHGGEGALYVALKRKGR